jgi:hypothetical protein
VHSDQLQAEIKAWEPFLKDLNLRNIITLINLICEAMKTLTTVSIILGILTLLSILFSHLALTDIYHHTEPDLGLEWNIVRLGYLLTFTFVVIALATILKKKAISE